MLTLEQLKAMPPKTIFAKGEIENSPEGLFMTGEYQGRMLSWVAKRGDIEDWAIYTHWARRSIEFVADHGDKVMDKKNIKKLVPCTDEAFAMYRY